MNDTLTDVTARHMKDDNQKLSLNQKYTLARNHSDSGMSIDNMRPDCHRTQMSKLFLLATAESEIYLQNNHNEIIMYW